MIWRGREREREREREDVVGMLKDRVDGSGKIVQKPERKTIYCI